MDTKKLKRARIINEVLTLLLTLLILIIVYFLAVNFFNFRWDTTTTGEFSLSDLTLKVLKNVKKKDQNILVSVFYRPHKSPEERLKRLRILDLLDEYHLRSGKKIKPPKVLNPDQHPNEVKSFGIRNEGSIVFHFEGNKKRRQLVPPREIWGLRFVNGRPTKDEFKAENAFTGALKKNF